MTEVKKLCDIVKSQQNIKTSQAMAFSKKFGEITCTNGWISHQLTRHPAPAEATELDNEHMTMARGWLFPDGSTLIQTPMQVGSIISIFNEK